MQKQSLQAYDRERDFSRERDLSRDEADRERDLSLSLSSFSRDLLLDSDFAFLLSRPPDLDLLLLCRDLDLLLSRLLLLLLSLGERDLDRDFDGERRPLRPPREPDLDLDRPLRPRDLDLDRPRRPLLISGRPYLAIWILKSRPSYILPSSASIASSASRLS